MQRFLCLIIVFALLACSEETQINHVRGVIFRDCNSALVNEQILLKANIAQSITSPDILAGATTDANGNFDFTYELNKNKNGLGNIQLVSQNGFLTLFENLSLNKDQNLTLYLENTATINVELAGQRNFNTTDTLLYSTNYSQKNYSTIQAINGSLQNVNASLPNTNGSYVDAIFFYGIGLADFNKAKEASTIKDSVYQNISIALGGCFRTDSLVLTID